MNFGVQLGVDAPTNPGELTALAQGAERLGFTSFWVGDHLLIPNTIDNSSHERGVGGSKRFADRTTSPTSEPLTTLAFLAGVTSTVRLGVAVLVVPLRSPVLSAKMLASIDSLAAGRLDIGVGAGWIEAEFEALRTPPYAERGAVTDDYLDTMIALWTQDLPEHCGPYWSVRSVSMFPHPVQQPHPPIWVGGNGGPAMRRAVRIGQGWLPLFQPPEEIQTKRTVLEQMCEEAGRSPGALSLAVGCRFGFHDGAAPERPPLSGTSAQMRDDIRRYEDVGRRAARRRASSARNVRGCISREARQERLPVPPIDRIPVATLQLDRLEALLDPRSAHLTPRGTPSSPADPFLRRRGSSRR